MFFSFIQAIMWTVSVLFGSGSRSVRNNIHECLWTVEDTLLVKKTTNVSCDKKNGELVSVYAGFVYASLTCSGPTMSVTQQQWSNFFRSMLLCWLPPSHRSYILLFLVRWNTVGRIDNAVLHFAVPLQISSSVWNEVANLCHTVIY